MNHSTNHRFPRHRVSVLGNHFPYNTSGYHQDYPVHYPGTSGKFGVPLNLDLISSFDYHQPPLGYSFVLPPSCSWPLLCDPSRKTPTTSPEAARRSSEIDRELQSQMDTFRLPSPCRELRASILDFLNHLASFWIKQEAGRLDETFINVDNVSFVRAFGSYGLGICESETDLDAVLIAPRYIRREDFFDNFVKLLSGHHEHIRDVLPVEGAFVPVVRFTCDGVEVDLTFATLSESAVTADETRLYMDDMLLGMDDKSVRSLNGWRVCQFIQKYVPNMDIFRTTLTFIKRWAKARLIYSNSCGYLGGVSWAILVAYVCREHASPSVSVQFRNFFACYAHWDWKKPIILTPLQPPSCRCFDDPNTSNYDPKSQYENHLMPIMTPCYPFQNSSFNVTRTTFHYILNAIRCANEVLRAMEKSSASWRDFMAKADPVPEYNHFLLLVIEARDESGLKRWKGCVESKVRQLMQSFENIRDVQRAQIFPETQPAYNPDQRERLTSCYWLVGIDYANNFEPARVGGVKKAVEEWRSLVNTHGLAMLKNDQNGVYTVRFAFKSSSQMALDISDQNRTNHGIHAITSPDGTRSV